jgi:hypothetical protein
MSTLRAIPRRLTLVWLALLAITAVAWGLGSDHGLHRAQAITIVVIALAFVKIAGVGRWFMELREAPMLLRGIFGGYVVVVGAALIILYLTL